MSSPGDGPRELRAHAGQFPFVLRERSTANAVRPQSLKLAYTVANLSKELLYTGLCLCCDHAPILRAFGEGGMSA